MSVHLLSTVQKDLVPIGFSQITFPQLVFETAAVKQARAYIGGRRIMQRISTFVVKIEHYRKYFQ